MAPAAPWLAGPAAANSLKVMWLSPPERGAPVSAFMLEMAHELPADRQPVRQHRAVLCLACLTADTMKPECDWRHLS